MRQKHCRVGRRYTAFAFCCTPHKEIKDPAIDSHSQGLFLSARHLPPWNMRMVVRWKHSLSLHVHDHEVFIPRQSTDDHQTLRAADDLCSFTSLFIFWIFLTVNHSRSTNRTQVSRARPRFYACHMHFPTAQVDMIRTLA